MPDAVLGRVFTLLDVTWSTMELVSLGLGGALVDRVGIQPIYWAGGALLVVAALLGLALLGRHDFRSRAARFPLGGLLDPAKMGVQFRVCTT